MGKSRLAAEVIRLAREAGLAGYGGECQSYGTTTSYLVWRSVWRSLFGLDPGMTVSDQAAALEARLRDSDPKLVPRLPLLGAVLNLSIPDNDLTRGLDAKVRKASREALLVDCLLARARERPFLLVLEDCHWLDPLSHDLVEEVGRAISGVPVLLLLVYRPPDVQRLQAPRVSQFPHFAEVALQEFSLAEAEQLIQLKLEKHLLCEADAPAGFVAQITERAAGNPFYIEELLNYLKDRGIRPGDGTALEALELPSSLHSLILTRMDQLTEHQQTTMKVASVIGRLFEAAIVWGAYPQLGTFEEVKADLQVLSDLDIAPLDMPEPELVYLFKHIITQEVAYGSLLHATRAMLHEQIGLYIERKHEDALDRQVSLLAFHFGRSENLAKKREYLLRAAEAAQASYANDAAIEYLRSVLPLLPREEQGSVLLNLGKVLELTGQWDQAGERYKETLAVAKALGDSRGQAWAETAMAELNRKQGKLDAATDWLENARARFEILGDEAGVGQVLHYAGTVAVQQGDDAAARELYEQSLAIRRRLDDKPAIGGLLSNLGLAAYRHGELERTGALLEESLAVRRQTNDRWAIAIALNNMGCLALDQGRLDEARSRLEEAVALQREIGDRSMTGNALNNLANVARDQGEHEEAKALYEESLEIYRILGDKWALAYLFEDMGCLAAARGEARLALCLVGAASVLREEIGGPLTEAERAKLEAALTPAREALDSASQAKAWAEGRALSLDKAIDCAFGP
jgi:predicted ATPase